MNPLAIQDVYRPYYASEETGQSGPEDITRKSMAVRQRQQVKKLRRAPRRGERLTPQQPGKDV